MKITKVSGMYYVFYFMKGFKEEDLIQVSKKFQKEIPQNKHHLYSAYLKTSYIPAFSKKLQNSRK